MAFLNFSEGWPQCFLRIGEKHGFISTHAWFLSHDMLSLAENFAWCSGLEADSYEYGGLGRGSPSWSPLPPTWRPQRALSPPLPRNLKLHKNKDLSFNILRTHWEHFGTFKQDFPKDLWITRINKPREKQGARSSSIQVDGYCWWPQKLLSCLHVILYPKRSWLFYHSIHPSPSCISWPLLEKGLLSIATNQSVRSCGTSRHTDSDKSSEIPWHENLGKEAWTTIFPSVQQPLLY